jgi:hypothetical protein
MNDMTKITISHQDTARHSELEAERDAAIQAAVVRAIGSIGDDYMTSEKHHPNWVLIPTATFERLCAIAADPDHVARIAKGETE